MTKGVSSSGSACQNGVPARNGRAVKTSRNTFTLRQPLLNTIRSRSCDHGMPVHQLLCNLPPLQPCLDLHGDPAPFSPALEKTGKSGLPALSCQGRDAGKRGPVTPAKEPQGPQEKTETRALSALDEPDMLRGLFCERIPSLQPRDIGDCFEHMYRVL